MASAVRQQAVLLDLFDTLVYFPWGKLRRSMAAEIGVPAQDLLAGYARTQAARNTGVYGGDSRDLEAISRAGGLGLRDDQITALIEFERSYLEQCGGYYADVEPFLSAIGELGITSAVVSNCSYAAMTLVERLNIRKMVDHVFLSFEVGNRKPSREIYLDALQVIGVDADQAMLIDDQLSYCRGAAAVGIPALLMRRRQADRRERQRHPYITELNLSVLRRADLVVSAAD